MPSGAGPHRLICNRYALESVVDERDVGVVWRARDLATGRPVAVEELRRPAGLAPEELPRVAAAVDHDARAAARLHHPAAAAVLDLVEEAGQPFLVTELVEGLSVGELVDRHGPLPVRRTAQIGRDLLAVLDAARPLGVVHGAIDPDSVVVDTSGATRLTGFGTGALPRPPGPATLLAPERAQGQPAGPAADLWSVGAVLHHAVTGQPPATGPAGAGASADEAAGWLAPLLAALLAGTPAARPSPAEALATLELAMADRTGSWAARSATAATLGWTDPHEATGAPAGPAAAAQPGAAGAAPVGDRGVPGPRAAGRRVRRRSGLRTGLVVSAVSIGLAAVAFLGSVRLLGGPAEPDHRRPLPTLAPGAAADAAVAIGAASTTTQAPSTTAARVPTTTATTAPPTTVPPTTAPLAPFSVEAEAGGNTLAGGARTAACGGCSGGAKVGFVGNGGTLQFNGITVPALGPYRLTISYATGEDRAAALSVNGGIGMALRFPSSGDFERVRRLTVTVTLRAGPNTLTFSNGQGWAPDFDRIRVRPA